MDTNTTNLAGKVALVTGGGSGIGAECAKQLCERGAAVVISDIDARAAKCVADDLANGAHQVISIAHDVTDPGDWERAVGAAVEHFGGLDILVNNAGITGERHELMSYDIATWHQVININLNGVFLGLRACGPAMQARGAGSVINLSSILGKVGSTGTAAYCASKGAVTQLTKAAALEWAPFNIRVNSLHPGYIDTPLVHNALAALEDGPEMLAMITAGHPLGRLGTVQEIARAVVFLASDDASFMTGSEMVVDGGFTAQ